MRKLYPRDIAKIRNTISFVGCVIFAVLIIINFRPITFLIPILTGILTIYIDYKYYRCPHCGNHLPKNPRFDNIKDNIEYCPFCNKDVNREYPKEKAKY